MPPPFAYHHDKEIRKEILMPDHGKLIEWQHEELSKPFDFSVDQDRIFRRKSDAQINLQQAYVRARLIEIYGHHGWSDKNLALEEIPLRIPHDEQGYFAVAYRAQQRLTVYPPGSGPRSFDGAGAWGIQTDGKTRRPAWEMHSDAMNGARSVALCRAAKSLGTQFGLSLYETDPAAFKVQQSLPLRYLKEQAEASAKDQQLDLTDDYTADPDEVVHA